jgi:hypothetical protein
MEDATFQKKSVAAIWSIKDKEAKKIEVLHIQIATHICIYLHKCIHMFSHISCGQVFLTIYTNKYIYIYYCRCMQIDFKKSIGNLGFKP